ncbi:Methyltransferase domain protein [Lacunisphaera limnophila]|uniref:Methyltransferase domain protein n=1 Tax=Lacunisphaera limnophila TaxID=1838286 RepID=A0A1D8AVT3_9BACT|nr:class I SAM-dependent methyltransferase [Lacunisphaera limnophila]AOS44976.1 Methyltransferase domain protein [Lacunisphaera limnophila]
MIGFTSDGREQTLPPGGHYARPGEHGFRDTPSTDLHALVAEIDAGRPWREAVAARYQTSKNWLYRIITAESRTAFVGPVLPPGAGPVLDIGSGWGQVARPLARERPVVALEPVAERLAFIRAAARQDGVSDRMAFMETDYFDVQFRTPFAAICAIGVLEWAGAFQDHTDPQQRQRAFLRKARTELAPDGCLILGIENRLGLKYLLGCPDDHVGVPHVASLPAPLARRRWDEAGQGRLQSFTYSLIELRRLLLDTGFTRIEFFGAFPDYKLPAAIIPLDDEGRELNAWLTTQPVPAEHNGYDGTLLPPGFQLDLQRHYRELAARGTAQHFVPSFFVRAG